MHCTYMLTILFDSILTCTQGGRPENEDLYQIALLIDQLKHEEPQFRINAAKNIPLIGNN